MSICQFISLHIQIHQAHITNLQHILTIKFVKDFYKRLFYQRNTVIINTIYSYIQLSWTRCDVVTTSGRSLCAVNDDVTPVVELGLQAFTPLFTLPKLWYDCNKEYNFKSELLTTRKVIKPCHGLTTVKTQLLESDGNIYLSGHQNSHENSSITTIRLTDDNNKEKHFRETSQNALGK